MFAACARRCVNVAATKRTPQTLLNGKCRFYRSRTHNENHYSVLGLANSATPAEVKKAFFALSKDYHPDRNLNNAKAHDKYIRITEAYTILKDPIRKREYDQYLSGGRPVHGYGGENGSSSAAYGYERRKWDSDRYGHMGGRAAHEQGAHDKRKNKYSNMHIAGFALTFMLVGIVAQYMRFNSHYEQTVQNLQEMDEQMNEMYAMIRKDAAERGYKEKLRQLKEKAGADQKNSSISVAPEKEYITP